MPIQNTQNAYKAQPQTNFRQSGAEDRSFGFESQLASEQIRLGAISAEAPTVSHLLVRHPEYGKECWDIVHSEVNAGKPYTRIPAETPIYMNPETKEISWTARPGSESGAEEANETARTSGAADSIRSMSPTMQAITHAIEKAADAHGLSADLIQAIIRAESDFQPLAVSDAGAQGLMQLMPDTASELGIIDPFDIDQNIDGGCRYLKQMLTIFDEDLEKAIAAYNAGPGTIQAHGGQILFKETRLYVDRVISSLKQAV